jgi:hypothetical protein
MGYVSILSTQTDANSPLNQPLFDALRGNDEYFYDILVTTGIAQGNLKTSTEEESEALGAGVGQNETFSDVGEHGFGPRFKSGTANCDYYAYPISTTNASTSYGTYVYLYAVDNQTLYAQIRYIQSSRNCPVVWLKRNTITGDIVGIHFSPECGGYESPFKAAGQDLADMEVLALELDRSPDLKKHLFENYGKAGGSWCWQIGLGLFTGAVTLGNTASPIAPDMTAEQKQWMIEAGYDKPHHVNMTDAAPALYSPEVKVVSFDFHKELADV